MTSVKTKKQTFIQVLRAHGFKKMRWDKCPQGFQESNYPCYSHEEKNIWCEVYLTDKPPYGWIIGNGIRSNNFECGKFFYDPSELNNILLSIKNVPVAKQPPLR